MYSDSKKERPAWLTPVIVLALVAVLAAVLALAKPGRDLSDEGATAIRTAVQRGALQCYVVEGVYPPSLTYLEENYGLQVNTEDYYVTYDAFASNLPPTVIVTAKNG